MQRSILSELFRSTVKNDLGTRAAAIALFALMSIFPALTLLVWFAMLQGSADAALSWTGDVTLFLPKEFGQLVNDEIHFRIHHNDDGSVAAFTFHLIVAIFGASAATRLFLFALRHIAGAHENVAPSSIYFRSVLFIAPVLVFVAAGSILIGLVSFMLNALTAWLSLGWMRYSAMWVAVTAILAVSLNAAYFFSLVGQSGHRLSGWKGAFMGAALIALVTLLLSGFYDLGSVNQRRYGDPGSLINILLWFYLCSLSALLGAQANVILNRTRQK